MAIKIVDLADLIWRDTLNETDQTSIPEIAYWLRNNGIGQLNNLIFTSFTIDETTLEVSPESSFGIEEAVILVQLYLIKYYGLQANNFLGAMGVSDVIEYSEKGHTIRKLNRNEQSKVWLSLRTQAREDLKDLINGYKISKATPRSIEGEELLFVATRLPRYNRIIGA